MHNAVKTVAQVGVKGAKELMKVLSHGSDEDMRKNLQKKMGVPQTGKKPVVK
jgi:hypothetical protein